MRGTDLLGAEAARRYVTEHLKVLLPGRALSVSAVRSEKGGVDITVVENGSARSANIRLSGAGLVTLRLDRGFEIDEVDDDAENWPEIVQEFVTIVARFIDDGGRTVLRKRRFARDVEELHVSAGDCSYVLTRKH